MKKEIELFNTLTGWTSSGTVLPDSLCEFDNYIANGLAASLVVKVPAGNSGESMEKAVVMDLTGYNEIVFSVWSRNIDTSRAIGAQGQLYKIELEGIGEWFFNVGPLLSQVNIGIVGAPITAIRITPLHNEEDYLVLSYLVAVFEELPLDIFTETKIALENELTTAYNNGVLIATGVKGEAGDKSLYWTGNKDFLDRFAVILIKDGVHSERHHIRETDERGFNFNTIYDGSALKYSYTDASIYLIIPIEYGRDNIEAIFPGITIWGITPEPTYRGSALDDLYDTYALDNTVQVRREGRIQKFIILLDCEARHRELIAFMAKIVRGWLSGMGLWVNGQLYNITTEGSPTEIEPTEDLDTFPKIQYTFGIEIKEDIYPRKTENPITSTNLRLFIAPQE